jgi:DNA-binding SARP family transcriptional activator
VEFRVLGPLAVEVGGEPLHLGTPRQRTTLGLLLLRAGEVVSCDRLVEELWDGDPPGTALHTLQGYIYRLRRALGPEAWRLVTRSPGYQLKVSSRELDAQRFQDLATDGRRALVRGDPRAAAELLAAALGLWRGPLLADLVQVSALEPERARLEALRLSALEDRVEAELALGGHGALVGELEGLVAEQPFRERLWGQLMLALYRSGRQADGLAAFHRARKVLDEELGIQPSRWLCRRQEQILLQDAALQAPAPTPPPGSQHNLPAWRSSFVGRRRELAELQGLLQARRLVCVTGPPGSGKTRLAVEAAAGMLEAFPHGVFFASLAEVADPALVRSAVATALQVPELPERPAAQALNDHLRSRRLLLVLDNFEQLLPAAVLVAELLDAAPQLRVLATSRAPLRLSGEQQYPLGPLPLPTSEELAAEPVANDAVALFADRAAAVDPRFVLGAGNAPVVAASMWRFWQLRGHFTDGRRWLEDLLAGEGSSSRPRAKALIGLAGLCYWQGDWDAAEVAYRQARELATGLNDWWLELEALFGLAFTLACHRGELQAAAPIEEQFQALIAKHPDPLAVGLGLATSQMMRLFAGDLDGSRRCGKQCLAGTRALGARWYESQVLRTLALTSILQGHYQQAEDELRECLDAAVELGDLAGVALDLDRLGQLAVALRRPEPAVVLAGAADHLRESVGGGLTVQSGRWQTEHPRDAARRFLTDTQIDRAWAQGRAMSLQDAVAHARR